MSPTRSQPGPSTEVSLGVRGHTTPQRAHSPPHPKTHGCTGIHGGGRPPLAGRLRPAEARDAALPRLAQEPSVCRQGSIRRNSTRPASTARLPLKPREHQHRNVLLPLAPLAAHSCTLASASDVGGTLGAQCRTCCGHLIRGCASPGGRDACGGCWVMGGWGGARRNALDREARAWSAALLRAAGRAGWRRLLLRPRRGANHRTRFHLSPALGHAAPIAPAHRPPRLRSQPTSFPVAADGDTANPRRLES